MTEIPKEPLKDKVFSIYSPKTFKHDPTKIPPEGEDTRQIGDIGDVEKLLAEKREEDAKKENK